MVTATVQSVNHPESPWESPYVGKSGAIVGWSKFTLGHSLFLKFEEESLPFSIFKADFARTKIDPFCKNMPVYKTDPHVENLMAFGRLVEQVEYYQAGCNYLQEAARHKINSLSELAEKAHLPKLGLDDVLCESKDGISVITTPFVNQMLEAHGLSVGQKFKSTTILYPKEWNEQPPMPAADHISPNRRDVAYLKESAASGKRI